MINLLVKIHMVFVFKLALILIPSKKIILKINIQIYSGMYLVYKNLMTIQREKILGQN